MKIKAIFLFVCLIGWSVSASSVFKKLMGDYPYDGRAYFFDSVIPFWQYYFGDQNDKVAHIFLDRSEEALSVGQKQLENNSQDMTMVLMLSGEDGLAEEKYRLVTGMNTTYYLQVLQYKSEERLKAL